MSEELQSGFVDESEDDVILPGELATEGDELEEEEEQQPEGTEQPAEGQPAEGEQPPAAPQPQTVTMTQDELNRLISDRLDRDRRVREQEYMAQQQQIQQQQAVNAHLEQQWTNYYNQLFTGHYNNKYQFYTGTLGLDEESAKARAAQEADYEARRDYQIAATNWQFQQAQQQQVQREQYTHQQQKMVQMMAAYERDRAAATRNPMVARYIDQIDQFAGRGSKLNFETAKRYVLGSVMENELTANARATEQRTMANINSRKNLGVMGGSQPGGAATGGNVLTAAEKRMAAALGISPKDYAANKKQPKR